MVTSEAPRAFNREMYHDHPENVFYGTDDGAQDGSFSEFAQIKAHYENVAPERRENIHMISVVGGRSGSQRASRSLTSIRPPLATSKLFSACSRPAATRLNFSNGSQMAISKPTASAKSLSARTFG
jgi:hypothetical protein